MPKMTVYASKEEIDSKDLVSIEDLTEECHVSVKTIQNKIKAWELKAKAYVERENSMYLNPLYSLKEFKAAEEREKKKSEPNPATHIFIEEAQKILLSSNSMSDYGALDNITFCRNVLYLFGIEPAGRTQTRTLFFSKAKVEALREKIVEVIGSLKDEQT